MVCELSRTCVRQQCIVKAFGRVPNSAPSTYLSTNMTCAKFYPFHNKTLPNICIPRKWPKRCKRKDLCAHEENMKEQSVCAVSSIVKSEFIINKLCFDKIAAFVAVATVVYCVLIKWLHLWSLTASHLSVYSFRMALLKL